MTPQQKLKHMILNRIADYRDYPATEVTAENVDELFSTAGDEDEDAVQDMRNEVREGDEVTDVQCEWSRHYESKSVAAKAPDGTWIGWTYWYGGGKHGEPESIDWMEDAYDLNCVEEEKLVVVREFTKIA